MQLIKAFIVLLISTVVLLTDSLPVSKRQAPLPPPPFNPSLYGGDTNAPSPVKIQTIEAENPGARCIQLESYEEQDLLCILDRLEDDYEQARATCNEVNCGCSFQTPPPTDPETAFATLFSWLVEDVHLYKEYGVASNYSETICRLERMMRTQPNEYSLNATIREYCECNSNASCGSLLAQVQETGSSSGQSELNTHHEHDYCFLKEIHTTMGYIINEIEGITNRGFDKSSKCIRANSRQEITLKEFKDDIDVVIKRLNRTNFCRLNVPQQEAFYQILSQLQEPLLNSSNSDLQYISVILSEEILPILYTLLDRTDINFKNFTVTLPESRDDYCLVKILSVNFVYLYDDLKTFENNLITKQCLPHAVAVISTTPIVPSDQSSPRPRTSTTSRFRTRTRTPSFPPFS